MKGFYIAAILYFALLGCRKETIDLYSGKSLLYFDYSLHTSNQRNPERIDTTLFTFSLANEQVTDSTLKVQISLMGIQADHDRAINIQVVDSATTAIAGVHYEPLTTTYVLPANQSVVYIPVHIYRTAEMSQQQYRLQLQLQPNQDFDTTITQPDSKKGVSTSTLTLYIDDQIAKPGRWLDGYLGTFSRKKILLICSQLNMTVNDFTTIAVAEVIYIGKAMQRYLNQQKDSGNTIYEDDGTEMIMGTLSQ
ncbi:DUF4843 domain-containing protein [Chitinophaga sp. CF418]|uniref:DUF4843 domain-containing protein n=1 Tax=Chitinophaga sp. CF418 TaxID=1855287 RepID=UPI0009235AD1|nr:DUF4843 domain-containing protein [Chitinophaga sp. CF418]SHN36452.1 protein of unknown function [Chitinophaga sp. CF418]